MKTQKTPYLWMSLLLATPAIIPALALAVDSTSNTTTSQPGDMGANRNNATTSAGSTGGSSNGRTTTGTTAGTSSDTTSATRDMNGSTTTTTTQSAADRGVATTNDTRSAHPSTFGIIAVLLALALIAWAGTRSYRNRDTHA